MFYKNCSYTAKTFYGVTFQPGETKKVDGIINNKWMVPSNDSATKATQSVQKEPSSEKPKEEQPKPVEPEIIPEPAKEEQPDQNKEDQKHQGKGKKS